MGVTLYRSLLPASSVSHWSFTATCTRSYFLHLFSSHPLKHTSMLMSPKEDIGIHRNFNIGVSEYIEILFRSLVGLSTSTVMYVACFRKPLDRWWGCRVDGNICCLFAIIPSCVLSKKNGVLALGGVVFVLIFAWV